MNPKGGAVEWQSDGSAPVRQFEETRSLGHFGDVVAPGRPGTNPIAHGSRPNPTRRFRQWIADPVAVCGGVRSDKSNLPDFRRLNFLRR